MRLPSPVLHERTVRLAKESAALTIVDRLSGTGAHRLDWHFHLAPGIDVERVAPGEFVLRSSSRRFRLRAPVEADATIADAWYSPSYGVRVPCRALDLTLETRLSGVASYSFAIDREDRDP